MDINFVESNPIPVKAAMAMMGLCEPVWRLPMTPPSAAESGEDRGGVEASRVIEQQPEHACRLRSRSCSIRSRRAYTEEHFALFQRFKQALNAGTIRSAEPDSSARSGWRVNAWVKKGVLLGFRMGAVVDMSVDPARQPIFEKPHVR